MYLVSLSISDTLFLTLNYIPQIVYYHKGPLRNSLPSSLFSFIFLFSWCSFGTVTLVSLERFLAICYPIKHHLIKGTRRTNKLICLVWCISFGLTPAYIFITETSSFCVIWPVGSVYAEYPNQFTTFRSTYWTYDPMLFMNFAIFVFLMIFNNILYIKIYFAGKGRNNND